MAGVAFDDAELARQLEDLREQQRAAVEDTVETAPAGQLELKGFARPVPAYEVRGLR
jgi:class 3 adenylate cyclase